jgi:DNA-binding LacI/PurR family transcriptional regulator
MATIADVARLAKVSKSTVSRVLNALPVSEKAYQSVTEAMKSLNYQPNAQARSLTLRRTNLIGVVGPFVGGIFYGEIISGILEVMSAANNFVTICSTENNTHEIEIVDRLLREKRIDGMIIITPRRMKTDILRNYKGFPIVVVDGVLDTVHSVTIDNFEGGLIAGHHLVGLGHRDMAMITGPLDSWESTERLRGFKDALASSGVELNKEYIYEGNYDLESGRAGMEYLLSLKHLPSAVFAANDWMAIGAMDVLKEKGLRIPEDIAVVGFDDSILAAWVKPALTTVRQPVYELGRIGARRMLETIAKADSFPSTTLLRCSLVVRESCGANRDKNKTDKASDLT